MKNRYISPFKPRKISDVRTSDIKIYTFNAGYKKFKDDLLVIVFEKPVNLAAVFTKSSFPSAPVIWDKRLYKKNLCKVLIVNSGNANAYTGVTGIESIEHYAFFAAKIFNCKINQVYVSSTGIIGEQLNPKLIIAKLKSINIAKSNSLIQAAKAIMTTDTFPKIAIETTKINNKKIRIYGIAKGSGMVAPDMGTMLSYIFIEAPLNKIELNKLLKTNIEDTFNSISVDGDMSTSDTVMLFSIGNKKLRSIVKKNQAINLISNSLKKLMKNLSQQIVCDGEGVSKLIEVNVYKAKNKIQAKKIAFSIAESLLVKTAIYGEDVNWGRVIMAVGKTTEKINQKKISLKFGENVIIKNGTVSKNMNNKKLRNYMKNKTIKINLDLGLGLFKKTVWSSDLTKKYVEINADYHS